jgi:hypothetical protein
MATKQEILDNKPSICSSDLGTRIHLSTTELIARAEENSRWVGRNHARLVRKYNDKWVAVLDKRVIDSDKNLKTMVSRLRRTLGDRYSEVSIQYITKKPIYMVLVV